MSLADDVRALTDEMRNRRAAGRCAMPGCPSPSPGSVPHGLCDVCLDVCLVPIIGCWPELPPTTRRAMVLLLASMLEKDEARPLPPRLSWWRPAESRVIDVQATDDLPPGLFHFMAFTPDTEAGPGNGRIPCRLRPWRRWRRTGTLLN